MVTSKTHKIGLGELIGVHLYQLMHRAGRVRGTPWNILHLTLFPFSSFRRSAQVRVFYVQRPGSWFPPHVHLRPLPAAPLPWESETRKMRFLTKKANISQHTKTNYSWDGSKNINCPGEQRVSNMTGSVPGRYDFGEEESFTSGLMWYEAKASLVL